MSAEILEASDIRPSLVGGGGGVFDVEVDGELVFSKAEQGRFPAVGEIPQLIGL